MSQIRVGPRFNDRCPCKRQRGEGTERSPCEAGGTGRRDAAPSRSPWAQEQGEAGRASPRALEGAAPRHWLRTPGGRDTLLLVKPPSPRWFDMAAQETSKNASRCCGCFYHSEEFSVPLKCLNRNPGLTSAVTSADWQHLLRAEPKGGGFGVDGCGSEV